MQGTRRQEEKTLKSSHKPICEMGTVRSVQINRTTEPDGTMAEGYRLVIVVDVFGTTMLLNLLKRIWAPK
jgi:hypothetical protein